jgi:dihydropyrimidinase/allantoinase
MEQVDLNIRSGLIATKDGSFKGNISVSEGKIVAISSGETLPKAGETVDAEGYLIIPGVIDPHIHSRVPGFPQREDFRTASMAAAAGGVTTFFDMPNSVPPVNSVDVMRDKIAIGEAESCVDFGIIAGGGSDNLDQISHLAKEGVVGFKTFLHAPPEGREKEFKGLCAENDGVVLEVLKAIEQAGAISLIHAENAQITQYLTDYYKSKGDRSMDAFFLSRPPIAEIEAVSRILYFAAETKVALHLCHMSTSGAMDLIGRAKEEGANVSAETCPQYLLLTQEDVRSLGPYGKIHPPMREKKDIERLWESLSNGVLDMVCSDHCPYESKEKEAGIEDIWKAPAGAPGIETMLPAVLDQVNRGRISIGKMIEILSENAAKRFGLYPGKGAIRVGSDADLVLVDLEEKRKVTRERMCTKAKAIARIFEGRELQGWPAMTFVRGKRVMDKGKFPEDVFGWGRWVKPDH